MFVPFPHGAPFGRPGDAAEHATILRDLLWLLQDAEGPGTIVEPPYRWRRTTHPPVDPITVTR